MIRPCRQSDASRICEIYNHYVRETVITFEEEPVAEGEMAQRIERVTKSHPWLVFEENGAIAGYAHAGPWHPRTAYRFTAESTIYLAPEATGRGIGSELYAALLTELRRRKIHCVIGAIALPHPVSVGLHEKLGFSKIGHIKEMGYKLGRWVDVGYWQLLFKSYR
ncbi:MAG TPA: GNAT family N-acetyltransferase [Gammaproteobacteria bacterium]|nr:GNAT family N-acetyltransferase [Gammaproteobacteria bacterium]